MATKKKVTKKAAVKVEPKPKPKLAPVVVIKTSTKVPAARPKGAPLARLCRSEFETPHGWIFVLKEAVTLKSGEMTRKIFIAKPGHESNCRPSDREWAEAQKS